MKYVVEFSALDFDNDIIKVVYKNHQIENPTVQVSRLIDEFVYQVEPCKIYISKAHNIDISVKEPFKGRIIIT